MPTQLFTSETARLYQAKSILAKKQNRAAKALAAIPPAPISPELPEGEAYQASRLGRVRAQLDLVDAEILRESGPKGDCKRLRDLVEAQNRLNGQERELSMRFAPGSYKPTAPPRTKGQRSQPADFEPLPMARAAAAPRPGPISPAPDVEPAPAASLGDDLPQPPAFELRPLE